MKKIVAILKVLLSLPLFTLNLIAKIYSALLGLLSKNLENYWNQKHIEKNNSLIQTISHTNSSNKYINLKIFIPNWICKFRAETFSTKEPETLSWIDNQPKNGVFFDIGANIGLYSLYYASVKKGNVYAFEPSVFNLELLAKNIYINKLQNKIHIISNPLTQENHFSDFNLSSTEKGGALSSFGVDYGFDGKRMDKVLSYKTLGFSLDYLLEKKIIPEVPTLIKMDVDGIEHLILAGAKKTLKNAKCKTVLIEVNDNFESQRRAITAILRKSGFSCSQKEQSKIIKKSKFEPVYNQIWVKN